MNDESYLTPEEQAQLKEVFHAQTKEMLEEYGAKVLELESTAERSEVLRALERTVHTIKGDSMALALGELSKLSHRMEDYLKGLRRMDHLRRQDIDVLLVCGDLLSELVEHYCIDSSTPLPDIGNLCERLVPPSDDPANQEISLVGSLFRITVSFARDCQMHSAGAFLVRQRLEKLGRIVSVEPDPESSAIEESSRWVLEVRSDAKPKELRRAAKVPGVTSRVVLKKQVAALALAGEPEAPDAGAEGSSSEPTRPKAQRGGGAQSSELLRVEVSKIDRIMDLVGELVIGRSMVAQALAELSAELSADRSDNVSDGLSGGWGDAIGASSHDRLSDANGFLEHTLTELQAAVLKIRMVSVEHVFRRFPRVVRDLAHAREKSVELEIQGGLTELDKSIVDALGEPLLHLVRNAIDHGLESPEERVRAGKPRSGRVLLSAFYEGNHAHVVVEDDGRGIDVAHVARQAVTQGLIESSQLDQMAPADILNTIYQPGFSTKDEVSDISGRGIGMDVVRESIENLKGVIELQTAPGRGTRFLIRLPLTLAILRAVLVEVSDRAFAVPLTSVLEIIRLRSDQARSILGRGVLQWRDQVVPLVSLSQALGLPPSVSEDSGRAFVLLVGEAERRIGLVAERLLGEQELVVKPIEDTLTRSPGIAGASVLGNGRVVLILHTRGLLDKTVSFARKVEVLQ
ncbi:MAG: chemotaxis protein CheA [Acidobacteriota bacterium]|nr:MAG: chemotaxis protein CheA [Acidobacteriota bacterium]